MQTSTPTFRSQCPAVHAPGTELLGQKNGVRNALSEASFCQRGVPNQGKMLEFTGAFGIALGDAMAWAWTGG